MDVLTFLNLRIFAINEFFNFKSLFYIVFVKRLHSKKAKNVVLLAICWLTKPRWPTRPNAKHHGISHRAMYCGINTTGSWVKHISLKLLAGEVLDNKKFFLNQILLKRKKNENNIH